jgi:hypothetical protein
MLNLDAFKTTPLNREPFEYLIVPRFLGDEALAAINADYPTVTDVGSFPYESLKYGPAFGRLVDELSGEGFRQVVEEKFGLDLGSRPWTLTVRGRCGTRDGNIHTDSTSKIITVLIYVNREWDSGGGQLRLLRNGKDLDAVVAEVPPVGGTLVCFKRADNSWHGHKPFIGDRRVLQFNWVVGKGNQRMARIRHGLSSTVKRLAGISALAKLPRFGRRRGSSAAGGEAAEAEAEAESTSQSSAGRSA